MTRILAPGPPPLTDDAASAAIDVVDLMAAAVYGIDQIDVTDQVRAAWIQLLAQSYPTLPPPMRMWFATAPETSALMRDQLPLLDPVQRAALLEQWAVQVPWLVQMIAPAFQVAQLPMAPEASVDDAMVAQIMRDIEAEKAELAGMSRTPEPGAAQRSSAPASDAEAMAALNDLAAFNTSLQYGATAATNNTIGLMHAMSPNWPGHHR